MEEKRAGKNDNCEIAIFQKSEKVNSERDLQLTTLILRVYLKRRARWTRKRLKHSEGTCRNLGYEYGKFMDTWEQLITNQLGPKESNFAK
jgi:hypothetical protein